MLFSARMAIVVGFAVVSAANGETLHVPDDFATIQQAIDAAAAGDIIEVADGTYTGPGNKALEFRNLPVTLRSAGGPHVCIIDCENDNRAFQITAQGETEIVIDGFTVTRGFVDNSYPGGRKGGAVSCVGSSPTFLNCIFDDNIGHTGGAAYCNNGGSPRFINCRFTNQRYQGNLGKADVHIGAALLSRAGSSPVLINCTIADNACQPGPDHVGGGIYAQNDSSITLINCILWGNTAPGGGDQIAAKNNSTVAVHHSIVEGGEAETLILDGSTLIWGEGNLDRDPLFVDPDQLDYRPRAGSSAIDSGDNTALPPDVVTDLDGDPRYVDDPRTADTGVPDGVNPIVDRGAQEFQPDLAPPCPADLDEDGAVDFDDFTLLLATYGPCPGCPADLDGDGDVDFDDFTALLATWGPCA